MAVDPDFQSKSAHMDSCHALHHNVQYAEKY